MKKRLLVCMLSLFSASVYAAKPVLPIEHWVTKNGANIYYVYLSELPMVDIALLFDAGSARDNQNEGLAALTNQMIGQGAQGLDANEIAERFDNIAVQFQVGSDRDYAKIDLRSLNKEELLSPALALFTTIINQPNFENKSFSRVKNQTLQAILQQQQTPSDIVNKLFYQAIYQQYPYAHPIIGNYDSVKKLTPAQLLAFYKQYYVGKNATMVIVGDISKDRAEKIANQVIGKLPKGKPAPALPEVDIIKKAESVQSYYPANQTYIRLGQLGIKVTDPDYFPLYVGNYVLGGGVLVSRLFNEVRDKRGLTYGVFSDFLTYSQQGPFFISLQTRNEVSSLAIQVVKDQLTEFVQNGPTDQELTQAKQNIIGGFPLLLDSNQAILSQVASLAFYHLPLDYLDTYRDKVANVSVSDIKSAFQKNVDLQALVIATVGGTNEQPQSQSN